MGRFTTLIAIGICLAFTTITEPVYHKADVREGDGILTLLKRYELDDALSLKKFCELNELDLQSHLSIGKSYIMPILVFQYNGTSIRSTIGIDDWDLAVRIANYNKALQANGLRESSYQESKVLWVPYHELADHKTEIKENMLASRKTIEVPILGEEHENLIVSSDALKGKVFYIVSGHGGPDPGALAEVGNHTLCEDEYAYDVSLRLAKNLMEHGATVELIVQDPNDGIRSDRYLKCDKDEVTRDNKPMPINQRLRLQQRTHIVNQLSVDHKKQGLHDQTVVCIHVDSQNPRARQDVYFYYCEGSTMGKKLAVTMQETFESKYKEHRTGRGYSGTVSCRGLYELRHTDPPALYVELANIQNSADLKRILPESNRQALANWMFDGLMRAVKS